MKREKMYFEDENADRCYPIWVFATSTALVSKEATVSLIEAVPDREQKGCVSFGYVWIEKEDSPCGQKCKIYRPRNGKSGACKFLTHGYTKGKQVTFRLEAGEWKQVKY